MLLRDKLAVNSVVAVAALKSDLGTIRHKMTQYQNQKKKIAFQPMCNERISHGPKMPAVFNLVLFPGKSYDISSLTSFCNVLEYTFTALWFKF